MSIMIVLTFIVLYAIGNAVRGGWRPHSRKPNDERPWWDESDELFDALHLLTLMLPFNYAAIGAAIGNHLGSGPGWGQYIGTYLNGKFEDGMPKREVAPIDWLIKGLAGHPIAYALVGMLLRGIMWSACVAIVFLLLAMLQTDFTPVWLIGTLGYSFLPLGFVISKVTVSPSHAWAVGEAINGGFIGLFWGLAIIL